MTPKQLLAVVRSNPRQLYWRWRLLASPTPRGVPRQLLFESLMMVTRAAPGLLLAPAIKDWSLAEARNWVSLLRGNDRVETHLRRAEAYARLPMAKKYKAGALKLARAEFVRLPAESQQAHADLWGRLLIATDPRAFERSVDQILERLMQSSAWGVAYLVNAWAHDSTVSAAARERLGQFIDQLPNDKVSAHVRIDRAEQRGLAALKSKDLESASAAFSEMAKWAAFDSYPGNFMKFVDAAAKRDVLPKERRAFLTVVLSREWRSWVRPQIQKRAAAAGP